MGGQWHEEVASIASAEINHDAGRGEDGLVEESRMRKVEDGMVTELWITSGYLGCKMDV